jgi:hypothetical protein
MAFIAPGKAQEAAGRINITVTARIGKKHRLNDG